MNTDKRLVNASPVLRQMYDDLEAIREAKERFERDQVKQGVQVQSPRVDLGREGQDDQDKDTQIDHEIYALIPVRQSRD